MKKNLKNGGLTVVGIDPGNAGAIVGFDAKKILHFSMPIDFEKGYCDIKKFMQIFKNNFMQSEIFLEEALPYGMNAKAAFTYGKGFAVMVAGLELLGLRYTLVKPSVWTKWAHADTDRRLKPKERSVLALKAKHPHLVPMVPVGPRSGRMDEGVLDATLIALYGWDEIQAFIDV